MDIFDLVKHHASGGITLFDGGDDWDPGHFFTDDEATKLSKEQWEWQKEKYDQNYADQNSWAWRNFIASQGEIQYQHWLNQMQMNREDNAVQRRVADLKASGLSPTLAAGSAASATPVHASSVPQVSAPQYQVGDNPRIQAAMFKQQMMKDNLALASTIMGNVADVSRTKAETELLKAQTDKLVGETPIDLRLKELEQKFNESTVESRINQTVNNETIQTLKIINESLNNVLTENKIAMQAYEKQKLENEAKIVEIEAKYADDHKRLENALLREQVKEKSVAVTLAEHIRDWEIANDVPISAMSPVAKTFWPLSKGISGSLLGSQDNPATGDRPKSWFLGKSYEWWHKKRDWSAPVVNYFKKFGKGGPFDFSD